MFANTLSQNIDLKTFNNIGYDLSKYKKAIRLDNSNREFRLYETPSKLLYPSVTSVLGHEKDPDLLKWQEQVGEEEAKKVSLRATTKGTLIHEMCENYLLNKLNYASYNFLLQNDFNLVKQVLDKHVDNIVATELVMYSDYLKSAGTIDLIADFNNERCIIDFKTSSDRKHKSQITHYFMQLSAYAQMMNEMFNYNITKGIIIMIVSHDIPLVFEINCSDYLNEYKSKRFKFYKSTGV